MMADRALTIILKDYPDINIEKVDIVTNPARAWKDGIRMIPALKSGKEILSGILLNEEEIRAFIEKTKTL